MTEDLISQSLNINKKLEEEIYLIMVCVDLGDM